MFSTIFLKNEWLLFSFFVIKTSSMNHKHLKTEKVKFILIVMYYLWVKDNRFQLGEYQKYLQCSIVIFYKHLYWYTGTVIFNQNLKWTNKQHILLEILEILKKQYCEQNFSSSTNFKMHNFDL